MIEVKVSAVTPVETAQQLKEFAGLIVLPDARAMKSTDLETEPKRKKEVKTTKTTKSSKQKQVEVESEEIEEDEIEDLDSDSEITLDELKVKTVQLRKDQGAGAVKRLLQKFEVERVTALEESDYVKFHNALVGALDA